MPSRTVRLAALQPWSAKARIARQTRRNSEARNRHFRKYNIGAATYDADYCRDYGEAYLAYLDGWMETAAGASPDLALLPEFLFMPGVLAAPGPGARKNPDAHADAVKLYTWSGKRFCEWAGAWAEETGMLIAAALPMAHGGKLYNCGVVIDERGRMAGSYRKIHIPPPEMDRFEAGDRYTVIRTRLGRIGFLVCYDIQFPEAAACLAAKGAELVLHPSAGYSLPDEPVEMGQHRLRVRASDHYLPLVYAGFAPEGKGRPSQSCVIGPNGNVCDYVRGRRTGMAVGTVILGGKRTWPRDAEDDPDREAVRRRFRHPETYSILAQRRRGR